MQENGINFIDKKLSKRVAEDDTFISGSGLPSTEKPITGIFVYCRIKFKFIKFNKKYILRCAFMHVHIGG